MRSWVPLASVALCSGLVGGCSPPEAARTRTGAADIKVSEALMDCAVQKNTTEVMEFLNTPSGTQEEQDELHGLLRVISKSCTDRSIIHTDVVEMRYRLKQKLN